MEAISWHVVEFFVSVRIFRFASTKYYKTCMQCLLPQNTDQVWILVASHLLLLSYAPLQSFCFSNFSLPQQNDLILTNNAYNDKTQIKFEFWWLHISRSRVMPLYKWKTCWVFVFVLSLKFAPTSNQFVNVVVSSVSRVVFVWSWQK